MNLAEIELKSVREWPGRGTSKEKVKTRIQADLEDNILIVDCWPDDNKDRYHLQMELSDWSIMDSIYEFLKQHLEGDRSISRQFDVPLKSGGYAHREHGQKVENEDIEEVTIVAEEDTIRFRTTGLMGPYVRMFERATGNIKEDDSNASRLLDFFGEISSIDSVDIPSTPSAEFVGLDEELLRVGAIDLYESGHYQSAIQDAFKILEERVRRSGDYSANDHGTDMMLRAFSPDDGPLSIGETESERQGTMRLFAGTMQALRNPSSHRALDDLDRQQAHDIICLVNLLLAMLEQDSDGAENDIQTS